MFNWLFGRPRFRVYEDSFARTRAAMMLGLKHAIAERMGQDQNVLLVTHFAEPFEQIQECLAQWAMEYEIAPPRVSSRELLPLLHDGPGIMLCLSDQLHYDEVKPEIEVGNTRTTCVVVTERHPNGRSDDELETFCRWLPGNVEFGYFMSFEDVTIKLFMSQSALEILDLFGLGENEMVTSNMISRRLKVALARNARAIRTNTPADSAEAWFDLNAPPESPIRDSLLITDE